jgi:hypothetical protein
MPSADHRIVAVSCCLTLLELIAWSARMVINLQLVKVGTWKLSTYKASCRAVPSL